jgi:CDP-6-deoxy-D-xylo-4-hexulose-3-dehydrase
MNKLGWPLMQNNITRQDLDRLIAYLKQTDPQLTHGPIVREFEEEWSRWLGVKYSVMVNSGSSANDITMMALRELKGAGDVIVPPLTWVSDISAVIRAGLKPVFVDIDEKSLALDSKKVLQALTHKTRAVFLTHVLGLNALSDDLIAGLEEAGIPLIEDACESHGAVHHGQKVGSIGWASNFSFYYAHHMTTIEGGMISTDDEDLFDIARMMRSHGLVRESLNQETKNKFKSTFPDLNPDFIFAFASHNMRPSEINGILGLEQLKRLDQVVERRSANFNYFLSLLNPEIFQTDLKSEGNSNYAFIVILKEANINRSRMVEDILRRSNIEFRRGLSGGGNQLRQPYLQKLLGTPPATDLPIVDHIHFFSWYVGNYPGLSNNKIEWLADLLNNVSI